MLQPRTRRCRSSVSRAAQRVPACPDQPAFAAHRATATAPLPAVRLRSAGAKRCVGRLAGWSRRGTFLLLWELGAGWQLELLCQTRTTLVTRCHARCTGQIFPVVLTNHGGWYYHSNDFMAGVTHNGDKADSFNIQAERFDHYLRTWASWQH